MKNRLLIVVFLGITIGLLSGCNQVEDIVGKASEWLDKELSEGDVGIDDEKNANDKNVNKEDANNGENRAENGSTTEKSEGTVDRQELPFDERLLEQGYEIITLPNGFPLDVPYHWILVGDNSKAPTTEGFEGTFCFDLPLEIEQISNQLVNNYDGVSHNHHGEGSEIIHTTTFTHDYEYANWNGKLEYYLDKHGNTCAKVIVTFISKDGEYGEDPATMISEEELSEYEGVRNVGDRIRSLPSEYDETLNNIQENNGLYDEHGVLSVKDRIRNGEIDMIHLVNGYPKIFPYEWYLLDDLDIPVSSSWSGTFCTDTPMNQAIIKHLNMLEDYNADISYLATEGIVKPNVLTELGFAFNDDYGTGSWHGVSLFFIAPEGEGTFSMQKCVTVEMEFSDAILD